MDLLFLSSLLVPTAFFCLFLSLTFLYLYRQDNPGIAREQKLPPGSTGWPIIGETLAYISCGRNGSPEKFINERKYDSKDYSDSAPTREIFRTSLAGETMAVLPGPSGNKFLFSNENKLVVSWWPKSVEKITMSSNSSASGVVEKTKKMRTIIPEFLRPDALQRYVPIMDDMVRQHLEKEWAMNPVIKVSPLSKELTFILACRLFMSIEDPERVARMAHHFSVVQKGMLSVPVNFPGTAFSRGIRAASLIRDELSPIIKERRDRLETTSATRDLMSHILVSIDKDGMYMTEHEVADTILGVLLASHETTSTVVSFVVHYLADHHHVYAQVLKEQMEIAKTKEGRRPESTRLDWEDCQKMKYTRSVINEVMRLRPPAIGGFKQTLSDFSYAGYTIPKGWKIFWSVHSTHKDPKYFPNPEKFDPSRFEGNGPEPFTFVPFGGGPRMCPGAEFARLEILVFIHCLVTKFRWEKVIPDEKVIYEPTPVLVNGLPIRLFPHAS